MKLMLMSMFFISIACAATYKDLRPRSAHFRDGKFHNPAKRDSSFWTFLGMRLSTKYADWPEWVESQPQKIKTDRVLGPEIQVTHINHSTVLIQTAGLNILTDPIYSERCSPLSWLGPRRVRAPGIKFEDLPPIDAVLISHDHYDHLDLPTIKMLREKFNPMFYTGLGVGRHFDFTERVVELDWWQTAALESQNTKFHFVPVQHFSGRTLFDRNETLWGGFVIETPNKKIYFGGDTGYASHFKETFAKFGAMDLALIPVGAYEPRDFMGYAHVNPEEAVQAHFDLGAKQSLGIHYGTFQLTAEEYGEPVKTLKQVLAKHGLNEGQFITPEFGQVVNIK